MEKKSLGRGIEDIADIFLSPKKQNIPQDDPSSEQPRNAAERFDPGEGKLPPEQDISLNHEDPGLRREETALDDSDGVCEIEEQVSIKKRMGYGNTPNVQQNIIKSLSQHLQQNYRIKNIELVKVNEVSRPGRRNMIEENILIYIKEDGND